MDKIAKMYNPCLKNKNEKYDPVFRARFPTNEKGDFDGNIYDMQRNEISKTAITNGCFIEAIVELTGIYFIANDFWGFLEIVAAEGEAKQHHSRVRVLGGRQR